jgi:electron transfer flavoprotein alpha subunit
MEILVYIEAKDGELVQGSLEALTAANELGTATAVVVGNADAAAKAAAYGAPVVSVKGEENPDVIVAALESVVKSKNADGVFFAGTQLGKDLAPRLAKRLDTGCVTDVTGLESTADGLVYTRPAFGGTVIEKLKNKGKTQVATLRSGSWSKPAAGAAASVEDCDPALGDVVKAKIVDAAKEITEAVNLEGADIIVAGGRGMGDAEHFKLVEDLAAVLGATVGASRPAIEDGWISRAHQIGQSGKIVAPKLYIACGISGAMQHISGAMGSKYIVAINKDPDASIFGVADLGIVGDAKEILPLLTEELKKRK